MLRKSKSNNNSSTSVKTPMLGCFKIKCRLIHVVVFRQTFSSSLNLSNLESSLSWIKSLTHSSSSSNYQIKKVNLFSNNRTNNKWIWEGHSTAAMVALNLRALPCLRRAPPQLTLRKSGWEEYETRASTTNEDVPILCICSSYFITLLLFIIIGNIVW